MSDRYAMQEFVSRGALRDWLSAHHDSAPGVWAVTYKKAAGSRHLPYDAIVEEALCFGWVDSKPRKVDDERTALLLTPRKPGSGWSRPNKERIARLEATGALAPAGRRTVEAAKADGSWTALDDVENLVEPEDLRTALDAEPTARAHWDAFPRSARRGILEWIQSAKRAETRAERVAETVGEAAEGRRANQWRRRQS
jgi:uncharacterized protein YdeI (YjbR/CyaY-like superfamily)